MSDAKMPYSQAKVHNKTNYKKKNSNRKQNQNQYMADQCEIAIKKIVYDSTIFSDTG